MSSPEDPDPERDAKKIDELLRSAYPEDVREELNGLDALDSVRRKQRSGGSSNNNGDGGNGNGNGKRRKNYGGSSDEKRNSAEAKELLEALKFTLQQPVRDDEGKVIHGPPSISSLIDLLVPLVMVRLDLITIFETGEILYYEDGLYKTGGEKVIDTELELIAEQVGKPYKINIACKTEVRRHIRDSTYASRDEFDSDESILNCKNGLLNMFTLEFKPHTSEYLSRIQIAAKYDPTAVCPNINKFLRSSLDVPNIKKIIKMLGDLLIPDYRYKAVYFFIGPSNNGKGTVGRLIKAWLGADNCVGIPLQDLAENRFMRGSLFGKMVNFAGDVDAENIENWALIRSLSGNDFIMGEHKGLHPFQFANRCKLVFVFNQLPSVDNQKSTMARLVLIPFDRSFEIDETLDAKLQTEEELSGLLNLALAGIKMLKKDKGFSETSWKQTREDYLAKQNHIVGFIKDVFIRDDNANPGIPTEDLQELYVQYCSKHGIIPLVNTVLGTKLAELDIEKKRSGAGKNRKYCYAGLKIKDDPNQNPLFLDPRQP